MPQLPACDAAYIRTNPDCIGEPFIKARGEIFERIDRIAEEMGTIAQTASDDKVQYVRKAKDGEWYQNVISILGERGSGKTILLLSARACLGIDKDDLPCGYTKEKENEKIKHERVGKKVNGDILLPVIQLEYFGPEDTLITWILTYLKDYVENTNNRDNFNEKIQQDGDDDGINPSDFIEEMRHDEALFSRKFAPYLAEQNITAVDFQRETLNVVNAQDRFMRNWRRLVNGLIVKDTKSRKESTATTREQHPFLIIPIDDADLNPAALPVIMQQIQLLQHPNVLFLFSVNMRSLSSMMYISQLELNTNRTDAQPVVNFNNLIGHELREVEDVRSDAKNKISKYLPHKYRVKIQPLSPKQRLDFKPLVKNEKTQTFVQLLEKIPMGIFGNKLRDISQFFDLAQAFKRCPLTGNHEFSKVCAKQRVVKNNCEQPDHCWNPEVKRLHKVYEEARKSRGKKIEKDAERKLGHLSPPIPSVYADALPKSPRAMDQLYHIMSRWVSDINYEAEEKKEDRLAYAELKRKEKQGKLTNDDRKTLDGLEKEMRGKISQSVQELLKICLDNIKLLPNSFRHRIKFMPLYQNLWVNFGSGSLPRA